AVTYLGLRPALKALDTGAQVRLLTVDLVEAEIPTVRDGRYPLRRPLLLLTRTGESNPTVQAFLEFAKSPEGQRILEAEGYVGVNEQ
ncbi:MAG: substrate-binding domain-containing protein, partial [Nitrospirales bacterium]